MAQQAPFDDQTMADLRHLWKLSVRRGELPGDVSLGEDFDNLAGTIVLGGVAIPQCIGALDALFDNYAGDDVTTVFSGKAGRGTEGWSLMECEYMRLLAKACGLDTSDDLLETEATNTPAGIRNSIALLVGRGKTPGMVIIVHDGLSMLRDTLTWDRQFAELREQGWQAIFVHCGLEMEDAMLDPSYGGPQGFAELLVGDFNRSRDEMYGPSGKGFQASAEFDDETLDILFRLENQFPKHVITA